jgi:uncharacterized metal-binding protein YceD (DUF177 family)
MTTPKPGADASAEPDAPVELSRPVHLDRLPAGGVALEINPSRGEAEALARRFGFRTIGQLTARVAVDRRAGGLVVVEGRLRARIVQDCVVTLDPVEQAVDEPFRLVFSERPPQRDPESGELIVSADPQAPEPLESRVLDIGEIVAEQVLLAADPYPRKPGVSLDDVLRRQGPGRRDREARAGRSSPFAALEKLRQKRPKPRK